MPQIQNSSVTYRNIYDVEDFRKIASVRSYASVAIQSQYAHSQRLQGFALAMREAIDASPELDKLYNEAFNPATAQGVQLDWWGKRVGVNRFIKLAGSGEYYRFDDDYYRFLIFYRALCNIANGSADNTNKLFQMLTNAIVFAVDYLDMTINSLVLIGEISDLEATILSEYGILNRPAGVLTNLLVIYPDLKIFGFEGSDLDPMNQAPFNHSQAIDLRN